MRRRNMGATAPGRRLGLFAATATVCLICIPAGNARVGDRPLASSDDPATWHVWHLQTADQFRLGAPPPGSSSQTKAELKQILRLQAKRTRKLVQIVQKWNGQAAVVPWTDLMLQAIKDYRPRPPAAAYDLAILYTGLYDAMIASADSRDAYPDARPAPGRLNHKIKPLLKTTGSTWAPSQAAMAGAAETILPYMFPDAPASMFTRAADQAVQSRVIGGLNYPSDVTEARALGQRVAQLVIAQVKTDGRATNTGFPRPEPLGDGFWSQTPPAFEPPFGGPAGTWRPWILSRNNQLLGSIPPPSTYGSAGYMQQLQAVVDMSQKETADTRKSAFFWDDGPGTVTPPGHWISIANDLVKKHHTANEQAARIFAYVAATLADAGQSAWFIKYWYWQLRPITAVWRLCDGGSSLCTETQLALDASRATYRGKWYSLITTPAFPSYPSAHSTFSGAASTVLGHFFPTDADAVAAMANQAAMSRYYALIHYPEDNANGLLLGRVLGALAIARAQSDGAR